MAACAVCNSSLVVMYNKSKQYKQITVVAGVRTVSYSMAQRRASEASGNSRDSEKSVWPCFVSVLVAALGSSTVGYAMGYSSSALLDLAELPDGHAVKKGSLASELFAALLSIGAMFGAPVGGIVADRVGRKKSLLASGVPNFLGWIMLAVSHYVANATLFKVLILGGRLVTGVAVGWLGATVPLYASEISFTKCRGLFGAFYQLSIVIGITLSYGFGAIPALSYHQSAAFAAGIVAVFMITTSAVYESPRWLLSKGHECYAEKALSWLRQSQEIAREEAEEIKRHLLKSPNLSQKQKLFEFKERHVYMPLLLSIVLIFFHQFSGSNIIIFYAATIFQSAGIQQARQTALYGVGTLQIAGTIASSCLVDSVGRKVLLVIGSIGMSCSSAALGTHFFVTRPSLCNSINETLAESATNTCNSHFSPLAIGSVMVFGFAFSFGWRALPFIVMTELFPLHLRGILGGIGLFTVWLFTGILTGFYQNFEEAFGIYTAWWSFALISLSGIFFVLIFIPETKGKTLEELEMCFKKTGPPPEVTGTAV